MPRLTPLLLLTAFLTSCGAIMRPGPFDVPIDSRPTGATVVYQGEVVGITPCVVAMERGATQVELLRPGFHPQAVDVGVTANPWMIGNALSLGLGVMVDLALGTDRCVDEEPVLVGLGRLGTPPRGAWIRVRPARKQTVAQPDRTGLGELVGAALAAVAAKQDR